MEFQHFAAKKFAVLLEKPLCFWDNILVQTKASRNSPCSILCVKKSESLIHTRFHELAGCRTVSFGVFVFQTRLWHVRNEVLPFLIWLWKVALFMFIVGIDIAKHTHQASVMNTDGSLLLLIHRIFLLLDIRFCILGIYYYNKYHS